MPDLPYILLIGGEYSGKNVPDPSISIHEGDRIRIHLKDKPDAFYLVAVDGNAYHTSGRQRYPGSNYPFEAGELE